MSINGKNKIIVGGIWGALIFFLLAGSLEAANISFYPSGFTPAETAESVTKMVLSALQKIVGILATIMIVAGGVTYALAGVGANESLAGTAKKMIGAAIIGFVIILAGPILLEEIKKDIPMVSNIGEAQSFKQIAEKILSTLLQIIGVVATIGMVMGGVFYLTAIVDSNNTEKAKKAISYSVIGLAISAGALVILNKIMEFFG